MLKAVIGVAIPLAAIATGLRASSVESTWLFKRPGLLLRSLLTILVILPVCAMLVLHFFHAPPVVAAGIMIAVVSIGIGPAAAFNQSKSKDVSVPFEIGLNVVLLAVAIVFIPVFLSIHGALFHHDVRIGFWQVAYVVFTRALIPLGLGMALGKIFPRAAERAAKYAGAFVTIVLLAVVAVALAATWRTLMGLGIRTWLICAAIVAVEIAVSHAAGGPTPATRRTLAAFGVIRFPALALLLASAAPRGREFVPVIVAYVLVSAVVVALYGGVSAARRAHSLKETYV
jgi:BASS family bile acid:Na+ symporter